MRGRAADPSDVKGPDHRLWVLQVGARPHQVQGLQAQGLFQVVQTLDLISSGPKSLSALPQNPCPFPHPFPPRMSVSASDARWQHWPACLLQGEEHICCPRNPPWKFAPSSSRFTLNNNNNKKQTSLACLPPHSSQVKHKLSPLPVLPPYLVPGVAGRRALQTAGLNQDSDQDSVSSNLYLAEHTFLKSDYLLLQVWEANQLLRPRLLMQMPWGYQVILGMMGLSLFLCKRPNYQWKSFPFPIQPLIFHFWKIGRSWGILSCSYDLILSVVPGPFYFRVGIKQEVLPPCEMVLPNVFVFSS